MSQPTTDNFQKSEVSSLMIGGIVLIDFIIIMVWSLCYIYYKDDIGYVLEKLPDIIQTLLLLDTFICGLKIVHSDVFNKKGTQYYTKPYGKRRIQKIISKFSDLNNYPEIVNAIDNLIKKNEYFPTVFKLQKTNIDFVKIWNDYNYYAPGHKKEKDLIYYMDIEKAVFCMIYNESKNITPAST